VKRSSCIAAKSLGISDGSLAAWVKAVKAAEVPGALDANERAELERLRKENKDLRMDREILRKAAAYFAKETSLDQMVMTLIANAAMVAAARTCANRC